MFPAKISQNLDHVRKWLEALDMSQGPGGSGVFSWSNHYKVAAVCVARRFGGLTKGRLWCYREELFQFNGSYYVKVKDEQVAALVLEWLSNNNHPSPKAAVAKQIVDAIKGWVDLAANGLKRLPDMPFWLSRKNEHHLHFANGLVGLDDLLARKPKLYPHDPGYFCDEGFPYVWNPQAKCPLWTRHLELVFREDSACKRFFQHWCGYCLVPDNSLQRSMFLEGDGDNGKTVCEKGLIRLLGIHRVAHVQLRDLASQFSLMLIPDKLLNVSDDLGDLGGQNETTFKQITGGEDLQIDRKFMDPIVFRPMIRFLITMNGLPKLQDQSNALWRRIMIIPFIHTIPRKIRRPIYLKDERPDWPLYPELPGMFNWAIDGLRELYDNGDFDVPPICQTAHEDWMGDSDPVRRFLLAYYEEDPNGTMPKEDIRIHYIQVTGNAVHPIAFGKRVKSIFRTISDAKVSTNGDRSHAWKGLRRKPNTV